MTKKQVYNRIKAYLESYEEKIDFVLDHFKARYEGVTPETINYSKDVLKSKELILENVLKELIPDEELKEDDENEAQGSNHKAGLFHSLFLRAQIKSKVKELEKQGRSIWSIDWTSGSIRHYSKKLADKIFKIQEHNDDNLLINPSLSKEEK